MALAGVTDQIVYLEEGDVVDLQLGSVLDRRSRTAQAASSATVRTVQAHSGAAELGPYRHYMQKEIFEQPRADRRHARRRRRHHARAVRRRARTACSSEIDSVLILACGTSYYAGSTAKYWLESHREDPDAGRDRERIPLPRQRAEPDARWSSTISQSRRDRRHAGRAEARASRSA